MVSIKGALIVQLTLKLNYGIDSSNREQTVDEVGYESGVSQV